MWSPTNILEAVCRYLDIKESGLCELRIELPVIPFNAYQELDYILYILCGIWALTLLKK